MSLFEHGESRIFKDAGWLQPLSCPPGGKPLCRNPHLEFMADFLHSLFTIGQARNLFIFGKPGTGKTVCIKHLLSEIRRHADQKHVPLTMVYVNAGRTRTPYYTMLEVVKCFDPNVPDCGWQMFRLKQAFENARKNQATVIAVDEVDAIIFKQKEPLIYYLNRQPKTTLILLSNKIEDATTLPNRALSTLQPKIVRLDPYTPDEAEAILMERAAEAFQKGVVSHQLLSVVAEAASEAEDIRLGFAILVSAGLHAEEAGKTVIDAGDVRFAVESETELDGLRKLDSIKRQIDDLRSLLDREGRR